MYSIFNKRLEYEIDKEIIPEINYSVGWVNASGVVVKYWNTSDVKFKDGWVTFTDSKSQLKITLGSCSTLIIKE